ncbi:MAG: PAS domain-containing protein, partial [Gammaproteobacteria bacterium]|nr:PAS domain-containing protein [Gammaproteobacteria bacterium]
MVTENEIECLATITCQENDVPDNRCNITYEQFMDATQTESIALFTTNENGVLTNLNPSCADLCQIKSTQIPQNTWTNILYPDVTHLQNKWKNYCKLQTQNKFHITIANPDKLNEESVHDIFCYPKLDKNQAIIGYSGMIKPKPETQTNLLQNNAYLYDQIDTCIIQLNPAGDIVYSNPACNKLLNLNSQPPVFTLENFFQHIPSDDRKSLLIRIKKYLNNKSSAKKFHTKCRLIDKTNSQKIKYLIFQLTQINSAKSHEILGYFGRVIDTTETVNLQNRDTIKSNLMRIGTYEMNLAGNLTNWEGQGENDPGYEYHFLEGDGWINTVHPEDKQALGMKWIQHIKSKSSQPLTISCRLITVNKTIWIKAITIAIIDVDNKISHYYGEMFDITHECKNQAELNSISREFKLIENKHPIGILRSDLNNNIYLNKNTSIMITGTKNSSFTLDEWEHYIHPDDKLKASSSWRQYIAN